MAARPVGKKAPAPEMYEATCPTCGMTADVTADIEQVRCKGCGTVVQLVDHPVQPAPILSPLPPAPAAEPEIPAGHVALGMAIGLLAPFLVGLAFVQGHGFLDQPEPETGAAGSWFLAAVVLSALAVFSLWRLLPGTVFPRAWWGLFGLLPSLWFAVVLGTTYADEGIGAFLFFLFFVLPAFGAYLLAMLITIIVAASRGHAGNAMPAVLVGGAGIAAGTGLAAVYMLATLQHQADEARLAHQESPTLQAVAVLVVLLVTAFVRRRRFTP